jgi:hypothetical protein
MSDDLVNWRNTRRNPIVKESHSNPILAYNLEKYCMYTMHGKIWLYYSTLSVQ